MNVTNENNGNKKLVRGKAPSMPEETVSTDNQTNFCSCFKNIINRLATFAQNFNEFEYGDTDEEFKTPRMDKST